VIVQDFGFHANSAANRLRNSHDHGDRRSCAGITEIAYQPMGQDIPRELAAFAEAAGITA
jgi:hypothetical protein